MNLPKKEALTEEMNEGVKCCADCKITKTPLWRGGPSGPKSLCNACGIRHRKKRSAMVGVIKGKEKRREKTSAAATGSGRGGGDSKNSSDGKSCKEDKLGEDLRVRLMALGKEVVVLQRRQRSPMKRQRSSRNKLGEVEQAAVLLMALSCGSVFS